MNIYELEKKATPGPLMWSRAGSFGRVSRWDIQRDTQTVACVYSITGLESDPRKADAQLLAHCRNNFMKALEALKCVADCRSADEAHDIIVNQFPELIAELEDVK